MAQLRLGEAGGLKFPLMAGNLFKPTPKIDSPISVLRPFQPGQFMGILANISIDGWAFLLITIFLRLVEGQNWFIPVFIQL